MYTICVGFLLFLFPLYSHPSPERGYLELYVKDATGRAVRNIEVTCKDCAITLSDYKGKARIKLPNQVSSDDWVTLVLVKRPGKQSWALISPWDDRVNVPSFKNETENVTSVIVVRKGDKKILGTGIVLQSLAARCVGRVTPTNDRKVSDQERKLILKQQAEAVGLTPEEIDLAIREWAMKAKDPFQQGLGEFYLKNFPKATELLTESYEIRKVSFQTASKKFADATFFLGRSLYEQGKYSDAVDKFQEALALKKDDPIVLNWLGNSLYEAGRLSLAEPILKRALEISEKSLGKENPDTASILNNLAQLYQVQWRYSEAEPLFKQALEINENKLGKEHPHTARSLNDLATLYRVQGKNREAEPILKRALEISEKSLGEENPDTVDSLNNLAELYSSQRRYSEAEPLLKRALDISEKVRGKEHPGIVPCLINLAGMYRGQKRLDEAEMFYKRALDLSEKVQGKEHPDTGVCTGNLAGLYRDQGRYSEAEPMFKRTLEIFEKTYGEEHMLVAIVLEAYASILGKTNREEEAVKLETRAKEIREKVKLKGKN